MHNFLVEAGVMSALGIWIGKAVGDNGRRLMNRCLDSLGAGSSLYIAIGKSESSGDNES